MSKQIETVVSALSPFTNGRTAQHLVCLQTQPHGDALYVHAETFMQLFGEELAHYASLLGVCQGQHGAMVRVTGLVANMAMDAAIDQLEASEDVSEKRQVRQVIKLAKALVQVA